MPEDVSIAKVSLSSFFKLPECFQDSSEAIDVWQTRQLTDCSDDNKNVDGFEFSQKIICEPDKTRVAHAPVVLPIEKTNPKAKPKNGMTDYLTNYNDYTPSDTQKYNKVLKYIQNDRHDVIRGRKITHKGIEGERSEAIAKMVCAKSEEYGIDPEITARILDIETGGFVFDARSMNPPTKKYKGVMQVDKTTIECMYYPNSTDWKKFKASDPRYAYSYDHRHYVADKERIDQLKEQYPTVDDLYNAMKTDVELGLEVGLIAYKGKLSRHKGKVESAILDYTGSQYGLNKDTTAVATIWPLPKYKSNNTI